MLTGLQTGRQGFYFEPNNGANGVAAPPAPAAQAPLPPPAPVEPLGAHTSPSVVNPNTTFADPVLQAFVKQGLISDGDYQSGDEVLSVLGERLASLGETEQYAQLGQQFAPHLNDFQEFLRTRQQAPAQTPASQPAQTQAPAKSKWQAPTYNEEWTRRAEWDATNERFVPKTAADYDAAQGLNNYVRAKQEFDRRLATDPMGVLRDAGLDDQLQSLRSELKQEILNEWKAEQQRAQVHSQIQQQLADLYVLDASGRPRVGIRGEPVLTEKGQAFSELMGEAESYGISDQQAQVRYAMQQIARDPRFRQQTSDQESQPRAQGRNERGQFTSPQAGTNEDQKRLFLSRPAGSGHAPSRGAADVNQADHGVPKNTRGNFADMALRLARQQGLS